MADLKTRFDQAMADSKSLPEKPDNMTLLKIYALYKQASRGDADGERPGPPTWSAARSEMPGTA